MKGCPNGILSLYSAPIRHGRSVYGVGPYAKHTKGEYNLNADVPRVGCNLSQALFLYKKHEHCLDLKSPIPHIKHGGTDWLSLE